MLMLHKQARSWTIKPPDGNVHPKSAVLRLSRSGYPLVAALLKKTSADGSFRLLAYGTEENLAGLAESIRSRPGWRLNDEGVADSDSDFFTGLELQVGPAKQAIQTSNCDVAGLPHSSGASLQHEAYADSASMVSVSSAVGSFNKKKTPSDTASSASRPTRTTSASASTVRA